MIRFELVKHWLRLYDQRNQRTGVITLKSNQMWRVRIHFRNLKCFLFIFVFGHFFLVNICTSVRDSRKKLWRKITPIFNYFKLFTCHFSNQTTPEIWFRSDFSSSWRRDQYNFPYVMPRWHIPFCGTEFMRFHSSSLLVIPHGGDRARRCRCRRFGKTS